MRFLVDAQLPPALAQFLRDNGYQAEHVVEIGPPDVSDASLWRWAVTAEAVIITKDADFAEPAWTGDASPTVVWVRIGNTRNAELLRWFGDKLPAIVQAIESGDRLVELR